MNLIRTHRRRMSLAAAASAVVLSTALPAPAAAGSVTTSAAQRSVAAKVAGWKVGLPYRFGAAGPRSFDCSGLVAFAYRAARRPLPVRTSQQMWNLGARIPRARLRRGDLVFTWDRSRGHVGIYLGANRYVHAPGRGRRVQTAALPGGRGFVGAVRP